MNADPRKQRLRRGQVGQTLSHQVGQAITGFNMIEDGDKVLVALSAGSRCPAWLAAGPVKEPIEVV